jgi:23S rRNA (cytidine1920-2'-O)/16S rRNA (cytidine1409-2'-O)-methyltransferase
MKKLRLDMALTQRGLVSSRSQGEHYIKLGYVQVDGQSVTKPGEPIGPSSKILLNLQQQYVSRAALKLASAAGKLKLDFKDKVVLDVGSSTGGFTDYALKHGAKKVIAVDVGAEQMHPSLRSHKKIELHERTDIRKVQRLSSAPDIVLIDVSFISLRQVLPHISKLVGKTSQVIAMAKPQFEAGSKQVNRGIVKNDTLRRKILQDFENWAKKDFSIEAKADSAVAGTKGNLERFFSLRSKT